MAAKQKNIDLLLRYDTDSIFRADIDTEIALNAFFFVNMDGATVHQLENLFRAHFNTLSTVRAFFHIDLYVSHRSGLPLEFRRITGSEIDYVALPNPFTFLKHTLNVLTRIKFYSEQIYQQINRQSLITPLQAHNSNHSESPCLCLRISASVRSTISTA